MNGTGSARALLSPALPLRTPPPIKNRFLTRTHDLTLPTAALLGQPGIAATDSLGRAVSHSTLIRALLRYASIPCFVRHHSGERGMEIRPILSPYNTRSGE